MNKNYKVKDKNIFEIGSNDGFLLHQLKKMDARVLGIDASKFMVNISKKKVKSIHSTFSFKESIKIKKKFGSADIIIANNVFNHSNDPLNFLKGVDNLLKKNSIFVFEQPYFASGLYSSKFDQIYHEHVSYFTAENIRSIIDRIGLKIISMKFNNYHGGSLRTIVVKKNSDFKEKTDLKFIKKRTERKYTQLNFTKI